MKKNPFQSRKFLIGLITVALAIIAAVLPSEISARLQPYIPLIATAVITVVAGITVEDSVQAWANRPKTNEGAIRDIFEELMTDWFGEDEEADPTSAPPAINTVANQGVG